MNKKLIASGIALTLCLTAIAPVYKSLSFNREILEPTTLQSNGSADSQNFGLSDADYLRAETLELKNDPTANDVMVTATAAKADDTKSEPASAPKKAAVKATASSAKSASTTPKKRTSASTAVRTTASRTSTSRGTTAKTGVLSYSVTNPAASSKASSVIRTAKSFIGVPYVWGGTSPSGFDCSGFTQYVLKKNGVSIPRVTADQFNTGISVSKSNLRVGDLVFFTTYKAGPSHVGFYIGNGQFIHASSSKGVTISSLSNSYFSARYIGARRVF